MSDVGSLGARIAGGAAWMIALRLSIRGLGFVSTIVLARLLVPADFGLVAMAMTIWSVLDTVLDLNFATALITDPREDRSYYDAAWTLSIIKGFFVAVLLLVGAEPIANYFQDPRIVQIVYVFAAASALSGLQNIGIVTFIKDLQLHRNFALGLITKLLSVTATVVAAIVFRDYWALVIGTTVARLATVGLSYALSPFRPRLSLKNSIDLLSFSSWLMLNNIIGAFAAQIDAIVVGRLVSAQALGIFRVALEISVLPATEIMMPARQALLPGFVKWVSDPDKLSRNYIESLAVIISVTLPIAAGICLAAHPLVLVLLGDKWLQAVPLMRVFVVAATIQILCDNGGILLAAMRRVHVIALIAGLCAMLFAVAAYFGVKLYGIMGAAIAHAIMSVCYFVCISFVLRRVLHNPVAALGRLTWRTLLATGVMIAAVLYLKLNYIDPASLSPIVALLATACTGAVVFFAVHAAAWIALGRGTGAEVRVAKILAALLKRRASS